jgi:hypothetical protein
LEDTKRKNLTFAIDKAIESFREYSRYVNTIEVLSTKVLQGKPTNTTQTTPIPPTQPTPIQTTPTQTTTSPNTGVIPEGYRNGKRILQDVENIKNLMR